MTTTTDDRAQGREEIRCNVRRLLEQDKSPEACIRAIAALASSGEDVDHEQVVALFETCVLLLARQQEDTLRGHGLRRLAVWCSFGGALYLGGNLPTRSAVVDAAQHVNMLAAFACARVSTIASVARELRTSRRALRSLMQRTGVYELWQTGGLTARLHGLRGGAQPALLQATTVGSATMTSTVALRETQEGEGEVVPEEG